jgi:hypothetical protein
MGNDRFFEPRMSTQKGLVWTAVAFFAGSLWLTGQQGPTPAPKPKLRNHFDTDALLHEPGYFDFVVLGSPGNADWKVMSDPYGPSPPYVVSQVITRRPAGSIAVALRRSSCAKGPAEEGSYSEWPVRAISASCWSTSSTERRA